LSEEHVARQNPDYIGPRIGTCWIPGNLLSEGLVTFTVAITAILDGNHAHAVERDAVQVSMVDSLDKASSRGVYGGSIAGVVRPSLLWTTEDNWPDQAYKYNMSALLGIK
jgi:2-hydroxychromene-2-carboxylate isomerase